MAFPKGASVGTQFKKGVSGNPGGMSASSSQKIRDARKKIIDELPQLLDVYKNAAFGYGEYTSRQLGVIRDLLDRAIGKPQQSIAITAAEELTSDSIPRMKSSDIQMLMDRKGYEFLYTLYEDGRLAAVIDEFKSGMRPSEDSEDTLVYDASKDLRIKSQEAIPKKKAQVLIEDSKGKKK